jgi:hypothetical protein
MPTPPPLDDILLALKHTVIPAAAGASFVLALVLAVSRRWSALGSAVAILASMAYANWVELRLPWKPDTLAWHWLPKAAAVLVVVGLITRWLGQLWNVATGARKWGWLSNGIVWLPRLVAVVVIAGWLVPERASEPNAWLIPAFAVVTFLEWVILDSISRAGHGSSVAFFQSAMLMAAGVVILYAHSARFMDVGVMAAMAYFGIAVVSIAARPVDVSGSIPAGVVLLPGLLLSTKLGTESKVPDYSFWLAALAPLVLATWLVPALSRKNGWINYGLRWLVVLIPLVIAVILAGQKETLPWEEEW